MMDSTDSSDRSPLLPPAPAAGRGRFGPMLVLMLGLGSIGVVSVYRDHLRPDPVAAATLQPSPTVFEATSFLAPVAKSPPLELPAFLPILPATQSSDAFAEPIPLGMPVKAPPPVADAAKYKLQSILIGSRISSCMINGRAYQVGDAIDTGTIRSIYRDHVVLRMAGADVELRLPASAVTGSRFLIVR